jgi:hypothetical protein
MTSPVGPSGFQPPSPRVPEMRGTTLCFAMSQQESQLLGASRLGVHTSLGFSHFAAHKSFVPPVFHLRSAMAHMAPAVGILLSRNLAIPMAKLSGLFLQRSETRSLAQIQWSSCVLDPTAILLSLSRDLVTWNTQYLGFQLASS